MKTSLKESLSLNKTLWILSVICIVVGGVCCILGGLGDILIFVVIATLAAIYLFDKKRTFAFITSGILLAFNLAGILFGINLSFFSVGAIICAIVIAFAYSRGQAKSDAAFLSTVIYALITVCGMILLAMTLAKNYSLDAATSFWGDIYDWLYNGAKGLADWLVHFVTENGEGIVTEAEILTFGQDLYFIIDMLFGLLIAFLVIAAFSLIGLSMKLFGFIVKKCSADTSEITKWRFATSNIYAYFYLILSLATIFVSSIDNVFGIAVLNLYHIFMAVYAYVGFKSAVELISKNMKPALAFLLVAAASLTLFSLAPQLLAFFGVISTFNANRRLRDQND